MPNADDSHTDSGASRNHPDGRLNKGSISRKSPWHPLAAGPFCMAGHVLSIHGQPRGTAAPAPADAQGSLKAPTLRQADGGTTR